MGHWLEVRDTTGQRIGKSVLAIDLRVPHILEFPVEVGGDRESSCGFPYRKPHGLTLDGAAYRKFGYLARFSRAVGYRRPIFLTSDRHNEISGVRPVIPHLAKNERDMGHPGDLWLGQSLDAVN